MPKTTKKKTSSKKVPKKTSSKKKGPKTSKVNVDDTLSKEELIAIKGEIETLFDITKSLQNAFQSIENVVNGLTGSIKNLGEKAKLQSEMMSDSLKQLINTKEVQTQVTSKSEEIDDEKIKTRQEVDEENYNKLLKNLLISIFKKNESKNFIKIKEVKNLFQEKFIISDEKFEELLMESHFNQVIELLAGTGDYKIKDHFGNLYNNISLKDL